MIIISLVFGLISSHIDELLVIIDSDYIKRLKNG